VAPQREEEGRLSGRVALYRITDGFLYQWGSVLQEHNLCKCIVNLVLDRLKSAKRDLCSMKHDLLRNGGIPALACVASATDDASLLRCTFQVKYDEDRLHATFSLQHKIHGYQSENTQLFNFIYDADNLLPTTTR
jgi:hypothetical protein